jgi:hypothetical protein
LNTSIGNRLFLVIPIVYVAISISACSESTEPVVMPAMKVTFSEEQFSDDGVLLSKIIARVENVGANSITYQPDCSIWPWFTISDDGGTRLRVNDPSTGTVCPLPLPTLAPGEIAEGEIVFGRAWDDSGTLYYPTAGQYTIEAKFDYYEKDPDRWQRLEGSIELQWE